MNSNGHLITYLGFTMARRLEEFGAQMIVQLNFYDIGSSI